MKIQLLKLSDIDTSAENICATIEIEDDNRTEWIRSCTVEVVLSKKDAAMLSLAEIRTLAVQHAYDFLESVLSGRPVDNH